jgi:hypothetical protein
VSSQRSRVYLQERATGRLVEAELVDAIESNHLDDFARLWRAAPDVRYEEHGHWDWRKKVASMLSQLQYEFFAVECAGQTQGMMIVDTTKRCRLPGQKNKHLAYVEYLESAPWNRRSVTDMPGYRGVGPVLIAATIQLSFDEGNRGRIGLHALPQADSFYRDRCKMVDMGPDESYDPRYALRYFEMTERQAARFLERENGDEA